MKRITDVASIDAKIKKWNSRLKRAVNAITKLEAQKKRLLKKIPIVRPDKKPKKVVTHKVAQPEPQEMRLSGKAALEFIKKTMGRGEKIKAAQ